MLLQVPTIPYYNLLLFTHVHTYFLHSHVQSMDSRHQTALKYLYIFTKVLRRTYVVSGFAVGRSKPNPKCAST